MGLANVLWLAHLWFVFWRLFCFLTRLQHAVSSRTGFFVYWPIQIVWYVRLFIYKCSYQAVFWLSYLMVDRFVKLKSCNKFSLKLFFCCVVCSVHWALYLGRGKQNISVLSGACEWRLAACVHRCWATRISVAGSPFTHHTLHVHPVAELYRYLNTLTLVVVWRNRTIVVHVLVYRSNHDT